MSVSASDYEKVVNGYETLKDMVAALELDLVKSAKGNVAASLRTRRGLRAVKKQAHDLIRSTLDVNKVVVENRKTKRKSRKES